MLILANQEIYPWTKGILIQILLCILPKKKKQWWKNFCCILGKHVHHMWGFQNEICLLHETSQLAFSHCMTIGQFLPHTQLNIRSCYLEGICVMGFTNVSAPSSLQMMHMNSFNNSRVYGFIVAHIAISISQECSSHSWHINYWINYLWEPW